MSVCKGIGIFKALKTISSRQLTGQITQVRHSHGPYMYRRGFSHLRPKHITFFMEFFGGFMWWWIMWHLWHQPEHIIGEFPYPDYKSWTNEELGVPPDDYEE